MKRIFCLTSLTTCFRRWADSFEYLTQKIIRMNMSIFELHFKYKSNDFETNRYVPIIDR